MNSKQGLEAEGWERRFVADRMRAEEAIRLYREMGYEVRSEVSAAEDLPVGCGACPLPRELRFQVIYTRRPGGRIVRQDRAQ